MPIAKALAALITAIESEKVTANPCKAAYLVLLEKTVDFQYGNEPPSTAQEFLTWRDAITSPKILGEAYLTPNITKEGWESSRAPQTQKHQTVAHP